MPDILRLIPGTLSLTDWQRIANSDDTLALDDSCWAQVNAAAAVVAHAAGGSDAVYGVNTGVGLLARTRIPPDQVVELQRRIVLSHAAGTGPALAPDAVRLIMALKVASLARGHSGVRRSVIEALLAMLNRGVLPVIPAQGSVGASGDLAPLAHLASALIGHGAADLGDARMPAADALAQAGLQPVALSAKEGLALLNGTQVSTALGLLALFRADHLFATALVTGAMAVDAAAGSDTPFDPRIHAVRGHPGQQDVAAALARLLADSAIRESHREDDERVQDPYSLRCQPQVMGAVLDQMRHVANVLGREANAVTDNPLVFADTDEILSGGNFHAEPVALAADALAVAVAEIGALAERRVALLVDANFSGLPAFLVANPGLNSGFMLAQVTAAALASENKSLAHPASVDSIPTAAGQEDHVSMATGAVRRLTPMLDNVAGILAIEALAAAQGLDFRRPLRTSPALEAAHASIRQKVHSFDEDRFFHSDIETARHMIEAGQIIPTAITALPSALEVSGAAT